MTCIAWDGKTLAVDSAGTAGAIQMRVKKWRRLKDGTVLAVAGSLAKGGEMMDWYEAGAIPDLFPDSDQEATLVVAVPGKGIKEYEDSSAATLVVDQTKVWAWGSGGEVAIGAMLAGKSARVAVKLTCEICPDVKPPIKAFMICPAR